MTMQPLSAAIMLVTIVLMFFVHLSYFQFNGYPFQDTYLILMEIDQNPLSVFSLHNGHRGGPSSSTTLRPC